MAIRVRALLRKWFGRGMYPTAEQFSDLFDSFFHKTEDQIPMSGVEGLTDQINGKYSMTEGKELEKKVQKVTTDLSTHIPSSEKAFNEIQNDIEKLDDQLDAEIERAKAEEEKIRRDFTTADDTTLTTAKKYADAVVAALVNGSPEALDTLKELAAALGEDPNFASTVAKQIGQKVDKIEGKGLSTEDFTTADKQKLDGVESGANAYEHPATHPAKMIEEDASHCFVTEIEKTRWNAREEEPHFVLTTDEAYAMEQRDGKIYIVVPEQK